MLQRSRPTTSGGCREPVAGSPDQRPSMGQDMAKGRRTEIVREGEQVGLQARANERLVDIVKKVERGELKQDPRHITELRLN
jgi:2-dehydropantoate 2-reductase